MLEQLKMNSGNGLDPWDPCLPGGTAVRLALRGAPCGCGQTMADTTERLTAQDPGCVCLSQTPGVAPCSHIMQGTSRLLLGVAWHVVCMWHMAFMSDTCV